MYIFEINIKTSLCRFCATVKMWIHQRVRRTNDKLFIYFIFFFLHSLRLDPLKQTFGFQTATHLNVCNRSAVFVFLLFFFFRAGFAAGERAGECVWARARQAEIKRGKVFVENLASSTKSLKSPYQRIWGNVLGCEERDPSWVKTH